MGGSARLYSTSTFHKPYTRLRFRKTKMNVLRICLSAVLLLGIGVPASAQVVHGPILVDEYSYIAPCDDLLGRLDAYLGELRLPPDQRGVIVLRNIPSNRHHSAILQALMESWLDFRAFDRRRVTFVRADANQQSRQFWRIPAHAANPVVERVVPGFQVIEAVTKPFLLTVQSRFGDHICPPIDNFGIFAGFLRDNPTARANIVVRADSPSIARRKAARILNKLKNAHGIQRKRLRRFIAKFTAPPNHDQAIVEYWYLP